MLGETHRDDVTASVKSEVFTGPFSQGREQKAMHGLGVNTFILEGQCRKLVKWKVLVHTIPICNHKCTDTGTRTHTHSHARARTIIIRAPSQAYKHLA